MRKVSNVLTAAAAAGVCVFISLMSIDADMYTQIYNFSILGIMLIIIFSAWVFGFRRIRQTVNGLDHASKTLMGIYKNKGTIAEVTTPGAEIFGVTYLDHKYQEYLAYLRKTNSPCDIGDYIGEYEINNYVHRRMIEMIPDVLTSLGILGTFVGLVWGLRGFNPGSYETMASSVSSLVDGIKVAFVTSIYGITLSIAFSYWLRGSISGVSEGLDNFLDKYYLCAVPPTDATAMNHVLSNQKEQTGLIKEISEGMSGQISSAFEEHVAPAMDQMNRSMDHFTDIVTMNQQQLLENIANQVMNSMKKEFLSEFMEMRVLLKDTNRMQKEFVKFMSEAQTQFQSDFISSEKEMTKAMKTSAKSQEECLAALRLQQEHLREFVDYMAQVMSKMAKLNDISVKTLEQVSDQLDKISPQEHAAQSEPADMEELISTMERLTAAIEKQTKQQGRKGLFRS